MTCFGHQRPEAARGPAQACGHDCHILSSRLSCVSKEALAWLLLAGCIRVTTLTSWRGGYVREQVPVVPTAHRRPTPHAEPRGAPTVPIHVFPGVDPRPSVRARTSRRGNSCPRPAHYTVHCGEFPSVRAPSPHDGERSAGVLGGLQLSEWRLPVPCLSVWAWRRHLRRTCTCELSLCRVLGSHCLTNIEPHGSHRLILSPLDLIAS